MQNKEKKELKVQMADEIIKAAKMRAEIEKCQRRINEIATLLEGTEQSTGT